MRPFIFGSRSGIYIIDLEKTEQHLRRATDFLERGAATGGVVLFIGTKKQAKPLIEEAANRCGMPYVINRWLGGTLSNFPTIRRNIDRLLTLRKQREEGYFERLSKKDAKQLQRQLDKLHGHYDGLTGLDRLPTCLYVIDPKREQNAVHEANRLNIPIVAICDTNSDPDLIAYPIPGNDDAIRSIQLITSLVVDSILEGRRQAGLVTPIASPAQAVGSSTNGQAEQPSASPDLPGASTEPGVDERVG